MDNTKNNTTDDTWRRAFFISIAVFASLAFVTIGGIAGWMISNQSSPKSSLITTSDKDGNSIVTDQEASLASVVDSVSPSVVSIVTSTEFRSFFGSTSNQAGAGTGIIISKDGYIITNNHVIDGASAVSVIDSKGDLYEKVTVIGRDPLNDVAFLKINDNKTFSPAVIGDSSTIRIGQQVIAIGNALGQYQNTVTSGIISGTGRPVTASDSRGSTESLTDLLQTDASINSGNSGGPLLNMAGQVIGINTAVASNANGIGFAIPINAARGMIEGVLETGKISRAFIGVNYVDINPEIARKYKLSVNRGAFVYVENGDPIAANSPAAKAGLKKGDIIQKVDDKLVGESGGLSSVLGIYRAGTTVKLTILRDGQSIAKEVILGSYGD